MPGPVPYSTANVKAVSSLYRRSLRAAHDWINRKDFYRSKAAEIRLKFEQNKNVEDPTQLKAILSKTEQLLQQFAHPDPIVPASRPGGTKYDRNAPPPEGSRVPFKNTV
ncbi:hypothetical protein B5S33_g1907 [[Candida] boidinii]|nr:hypothetical protein B5S27_g3493 [[Candida] boidinii]OWB83278.1 hypothetical protein B5S33_g1907 [[Candida] boidinii]